MKLINGIRAGETGQYGLSVLCTVILAVLIISVSGCRYTGTSAEDHESKDEMMDVEFTVCDMGRTPKELLTIIEEKKAEPFRLTFQTQSYTYIVVGYGAQQRGGCAVTVDQLYLLNEVLHIDTNLIGSREERLQIDGMSYPYIVVRCEKLELPVMYE